MPVLAIKYVDEVDLCLLLRMTLEKLPSCESLLDAPALLRQLRRSSNQLPTVSISAPVVAPTTPPAGVPTSPTPTFGLPTSVFVVDPDNPAQLIEIPVGVPLDLDSAFEDVVTVVDDSGAVTSQRKVPLDSFLLEALQEGSLFNDVVVGLSRGLASILNLGPTTISQALANAGNESIQAVHLKLGLPAVDLPIIGPQIRDALIREADIALLQGNIVSLQDSVNAFGQDVVGFFGKLSKRQQEIEDRVRGNLEILRIEEREDEPF